MYYLLSPSISTMAPRWDPPRRTKYRGGNDSSRRRSTPRAKGSPPRWSPSRRIIASSVFRPPCRVPSRRCAATRHTWSDRRTTNSSAINVQFLFWRAVLSTIIISLSAINLLVLCGNIPTNLSMRYKPNQIQISEGVITITNIAFSQAWIKLNHHSLRVTIALPPSLVCQTPLRAIIAPSLILPTCRSSWIIPYLVRSLHGHFHFDRLDWAKIFPIECDAHSRCRDKAWLSWTIPYHLLWSMHHSIIIIQS